MFEAPHWMEASCTMTIPRIADIRTRIHAISEHLKESYSSPLITDVPDEFEPQFPRLVIPSIHGNSQIYLSQVTLGLQVRFTGDWQVSPFLGRDYVTERSRLLRGLVALLPGAYVKFVGVGFRIQVLSSGSDSEIIDTIAKRFSSGIVARTLHDLEIKRALVVDEKYFSNLTVRNYRGFPVESMVPDVRPVPVETATTRGAELLVDFNDRHAFNQTAEYHSSTEELESVLQGAMDAADTAARILLANP